jgi:hypothetical protein
MRRLIALAAAVALALPLVLGLGSTPARAEGNTVANVALGLAAFSVFHQLFAPVVVAPAPVVVPAPPVFVPAPVIVRPVPVYRHVPVYRPVPLYQPVPMYPGWHGYGKVHAPVYRHGRPDRGHGNYHR